MIAMIGFTDLHIMQYLFKYTNILDDAGYDDYEVIFWNRAGGTYDKPFRGSVAAYEVPLNTYQPFWKKMIAFVKYVVFVRRQIRKKKYEKLIVLTTPTAIVLADLLLGKYRNRYVFDYRDISKEHLSKIYTVFVRAIAKKSCMMPVSSYGFLDVLKLEKDDPKILMAHNTQKIDNAMGYHACVVKHKSVRISFWGMVRQPEFNCRFCDIFGNDKRFILSYHGEGVANQIQEYCQKKGYTNIHFTGRYTHSEIPSFAEQTDIIHCVYEFEQDVKMKPALQVKLYDGMKYHIPILLYTGSYASQYMKEFGVSFEVNPERGKKVADEIYEWYQGLNPNVIDAGYQIMADRVHQDDLIFKQKVLRFVGLVENENCNIHS